MMVVEEVLDTWRDAERLLEDLPPVGSDHETVLIAVIAMRATFARITAREAMHTPQIVASTRDTIEQTRALLASVRGKHVR